jgi:ribose 5-phosphate isomerase B
MDAKKSPVAIGSDHAGYYLKESLVEDLKADGYQIEDFGTFSVESVDYPDIAREVAEAVSSGRFEKGILVCGTGIGISIAANKVKGIRAAVCSDTFSARMSRKHNNTNIIAVGARVVGAGLALDIVKIFLETLFEYGSRHERRVDKINALDEC